MQEGIYPHPAKQKILFSSLPKGGSQGTEETPPQGMVRKDKDNQVPQAKESNHCARYQIYHSSSWLRRVCETA